jgi:hypothetical protein
MLVDWNWTCIGNRDRTSPADPQAPHVRRLQLDQGRVALAWAARELGLPPPE